MAGHSTSRGPNDGARNPDGSSIRREPVGAYRLGKEGMGREPTLTPEIAGRILALLRGGCTAAIAYGTAGVAHSTYYTWVNRGREDEAGIFHDFAEGVDQAVAEAAARMVNTVQVAAAGGDVKAAQWWLERRCRADFGTAVTVDANVTGAVTHIHTTASQIDAALEEATPAELEAIKAVALRLVPAVDSDPAPEPLQ